MQHAYSYRSPNAMIANSKRALHLEMLSMDLNRNSLAGFFAKATHYHDILPICCRFNVYTHMAY